MTFETLAPTAMTSDVPLPVPRAPTELHAGREVVPPAGHELERIAASGQAPAGGLLQRACSRGGTPGPDGECAECKAKRLQQEETLAVAGLPWEEAAVGLDVAVNQGPEEEMPLDPTLRPAPLDEPAKKPAGTCPTSIKVAEIIPVAIKADQITAGVRTGWGAVTRMEVSGGGKTNWDGTTVHENLAAGSNDCDKDPACANTSGQGGNSGSSFTVGEGISAFKHATIGEIFPAQPKKQNCFYDIHIMGGGVDWCAAKGSCTRTCKQNYDCGGTKFGSELTITYSYSRATKKDGSGKDVSVCTASFSKA